MKKKILILTGTRADYGKLKSIIIALQKLKSIETHVLVTGMHNLKFYGYTYLEIIKDKIKNVHFIKNQAYGDKPEKIFEKSIKVSRKIINKVKPELIVVHGDRIEPLALSIVANLKNIKLAHFEGGEVSGTIDESIRHSITKLSHVHFVTNKKAKTRIKQLGEDEKNIFIIGSPDVDLILSKKLPSIEKSKKKYDLLYNKYAIAILHPVSTETSRNHKKNAKIFFEGLKETNLNYLVIYPNNDLGSNYIMKELKKIKKYKNFKILPSLRFEYFLTFLKYSQFIIGNSSSGIMEAPYYGVPCINVGDRQYNRSSSQDQININFEKKKIINKIKKINKKNKIKKIFGFSNSSKKFIKLIKGKKIWNLSNQKYFKDIKW